MKPCKSILQQAVSDSESSTLTVITQVEQLNSSAAKLLDYLQHSDSNASDMASDIREGVDEMNKIAGFVEQLPDKIRQNNRRLQASSPRSSISKDWPDRSRRSASRPICCRSMPPSRPRAPARPGRGFAVVAAEVRALANRTAEAADH